MFMVVTDNGTRVFDNQGKGMQEETAQQNADQRSAHAAEMGLAVRYEVAPFKALEKEAT